MRWFERLRVYYSAWITAELLELFRYKKYAIKEEIITGDHKEIMYSTGFIKSVFVHK